MNQEKCLKKTNKEGDIMMTMIVRSRKIFYVFFILAIFLLTGCMTYHFPEFEKVPKKPEIPTVTWEDILAQEQAEKEKAEQESALAREAEEKRLALQPKVSNIFVEADIRAALMDIATQTSINIITDESVQGTVSAELNNVPLETALKMILYPGGFTFKKVKDYYLVGLADPGNPSFKDLSQTKVIRTNIPASEVAERLSEHFQPYYNVNQEGGNTITLTGPLEIISRLEEDIKKVDRSKRQIEISALITDIQWEKGRNIGTDWGDIALNASGSASFAKDVEFTWSADLAAAVFNTVKTIDRRARVDVRANPKVVTSDGEPAEIKLTQEHYFLILSGGGVYYYYYTSQKVDVGVVLKVTPVITRDGEIYLNIQPEVSDVIGEREFKVAETIQKLPIINRRTENTSVKVKNGETITIGGLYMQSKKKVDKRLGIPLIGGILSHIPLLNFFFRGTESLEKDSELVIFITPRIIK